MQVNSRERHLRDNCMSADLFGCRFAVWVVLSLAVTSNAFGQAPGTGAISGMVSDPSGRALANSEVSTINEATLVSRTVVTTAEGVFRVVLLPPGTYSVMIKAAGFADQTLHSIPVTVSETSSLNV